jgi:hypothetical protein
MLKPRTFLFAAIVALSAAASPAFALPSGSYSIQNNASVNVSLTANTFPAGGYTNSFPSSVTHGTAGSGSASSTNDTLAGSVSYQDPATTFGCRFDTNVSKSGGSYVFNITATVLGGASSTAICSIPNSTNAMTGAFTATAKISGF